MMRNNKLFSKTKSLLFILLLSCLFIGQNTFAEGDGSGGGNSDPLSLVSSSISNGATGVSLKPVIMLTFSKNIVNMSVNANNKTCFTVQNGSGTSIPIEILFADDQIDREKRNDATITPKANLAPGTPYTLVVSSALKSKSGVTMEKDVRISFTTEGIQPITNPSSPSLAPNPETTVQNTEASTDKVNSTTNTNSNSNKTSTKNTIPNGEEKSSTEQEVDTQTDDVTTTDEKLVEAVMQTSDEGIVKSNPYEALESTNKKADLDKPQANPNSTLIVAFVIVLIAAASVYLVKRKKRAK